MFDVALVCLFVQLVSYYMFFFFQAEDGIRDYKVTGVQTCALPISTAVAAAGVDRLPAATDRTRARRGRVAEGSRQGSRCRSGTVVRHRELRAGCAARRPGRGPRAASGHRWADGLRHERLGHTRSLSCLAPGLLRPGRGRRRLRAIALPAAGERTGGRDREATRATARQRQIGKGRRMAQQAPQKDAMDVLQAWVDRSEEHTSELQSPCNLVCRLLLEKKKKKKHKTEIY